MTYVYLAEMPFAALADLHFRLCEEVADRNRRVSSLLLTANPGTPEWSDYRILQASATDVLAAAREVSDEISRRTVGPMRDLGTESGGL